MVHGIGTISYLVYYNLPLVYIYVFGFILYYLFYILVFSDPTMIDGRL